MTGLRGEPALVERAAQPYVGMRKQVTTATESRVGGEVTVPEIADRIPALVGWLAERGRQVAGAPFLRYHAIDMPGTLDMSAGVPVDAPVDDDVHVASLPAGRYVTYRHVGHPQELVGVTAAVLDWAKGNGLAFAATVGEPGTGERWDCRLEVFHTHPAEVPDPNRWETEIVLRLADGGAGDGR